MSKTGTKDIANFLAEVKVGKQDAAWKASQMAEAVRDSVYRFDAMKGKKDKKDETVYDIIEKTNKIINDIRKINYGKILKIMNLICDKNSNLYFIFYFKNNFYIKGKLFN